MTMTTNKTVEEILKELEDGKYWSIATSMYEEYFWCKDGEFHSSMENGYHDPKEKIFTKERVMSEFTRALADPEHYDVWNGF